MTTRATFCFVISMTFILCLSTDNAYGPFNMILNSIEVCFGPKTKQCTTMKVNITGRNIIYMNLNVIKNVATTKGKITVTAKGKELLRLQMNKPCEHVFLRPLIGAFFNASDACIIKTGDYSRKVDVGQIFNNYFGGNFFYGNIIFKSQLYSDQCNFSCAVLNVTMSPKI